MVEQLVCWLVCCKSTGKAHSTQNLGSFTSPVIALNLVVDVSKLKLLVETLAVANKNLSLTEGLQTSHHSQVMSPTAPWCCQDAEGSFIMTEWIDKAGEIETA